MVTVQQCGIALNNIQQTSVIFYGNYLFQQKGIGLLAGMEHGQKKKHGIPIRFLLFILKAVLSVVLIFFLSVAGINLYMMISTSGNILTVEDAGKLEDVDAILVLGASVHGTKPSAMLRDRLDRGIELYQKGISDTMLMSGDASTRYYNEVMAMELYAIEAGVPETAIIKDPEGLCTYDSIENAANQYGYRKILIVTQRYHIYRAMYLAEKSGMEAYGVVCQEQQYKDQNARELREIAARCKDFLIVIMKRYPLLFPEEWPEKLMNLA